jgi:cardiolipin synthase
MPKTAGFKVVLAQDYTAQITQLINSAKKRIVIAAMTMRAGEVAGPILQAVVNAARRGINVHIVADVFCQHGSNRPDGISHSRFRHDCAQTRELLNEIHALGGTVDWVGRIGLNPYAGRMHCKATIIDDNVFSFGGVNFCDDGFRNIDYMLYVKDAAVANDVHNIVGNLPATNIEMPLNAANTLLYDGGRKGESLIYDRACELAGRARAVVYVSQMCPTGRLADVLKQAKATCYFNQPAKTGLKPSTLAQLWDNWRTGTINHYEGDAYVHAKCMLFELKDGTKAVLSGSHNFSWRGVTFGTKEIALLSTDPELWRKLQAIVYKVATDGGTR